MKLTKDEWYIKLKSLVPSWVLYDGEKIQAVFKGMAAILEQSQQDAVDHIDETFIDKADTDYLDQHGVERVKERLIAEDNLAYSKRIKLIKNASNINDLLTIVNNQLVNGEALIIEGYDQKNFCNVDAFLNRNTYSNDHIWNAFTIIVENQGDPLATANLFANIISAVNKEKAFGIVYRLIEK
jgi:hypothetical protein